MRRRTGVLVVLGTVVLYFAVGTFFGGLAFLTPTPCDDSLASSVPQATFEAERIGDTVTIEHAGGDPYEAGPTHGYWWDGPSVCANTERVELRHSRSGTVVWTAADGDRVGGTVRRGTAAVVVGQLEPTPR